MADRINLNRFKNKNLPPNKNVAKTTAALTLLLSTVACSSGGYDNSGYILCCIIPVLAYGGAYAVLGIASLFDRREAVNDTSGHSGPLGSDPD